MRYELQFGLCGRWVDHFVRKTAQMGEHPGVLDVTLSCLCTLPASLSCRTPAFGTRHTFPSKKAETTSPGYFLDFFFFS